MPTLQEILQAQRALSQPTAVRLPNLGSLLRSQLSATRDPLASLMPQEADVLEAQRRQDDEETNFFFKLLQIPDRLLFGQAIKGGLKGAGEGGVLGAIGGFLQNNPLFQILDILPGVDIVDDTDFAEVREAFGSADAREGWSNVLINLAGEILTDPSTFLFPFAKVGAAGKALAAPARKQLLEQAFKSGVGLTEQAVKGAQSAFLTFGIPFVNTGYLMLPFKALDVPLAKTLERTVDVFNSFAPTAALANRFSRVGAVSRVVDADGNVKVSGSVMRELARGALDKGDETVAKWQSEFIPLIRRAANSDVGKLALKDKEVADLVVLATELGVTKLDDALAFENAVTHGVTYAKANWRRDRLLGQGVHAKTPVPAGIMETQSANAFRLRAAMTTAIDAGDVEAFDTAATAWMVAFPDARLPDEALDFMRDGRVGSEVRPGIDTPDDTRFLFGDATDERIADVITPASSPGTLGRAATALETKGATRGVVEATKTAALNLYRSIKGRIEKGEIAGKAGEKVSLRDIDDFISQGRTLMEHVGQKDVADGFLGMISELYVPRDLSAAGRELIDSKFGKFSNSLKGNASGFVAGFMRGRKFTSLTSFEVNAMMRELGTRKTGFAKLSGIDKAQDTIAKVFDLKFVRQLQELGDYDAASFFSTNPLHRWYRRLEADANLRGKLGFYQSVFGDDSLMVMASKRLGELDPAGLGKMLSEDNLVGFLDLGGARFQELTPGRATSVAMSNENQARGVIAKAALSRHTSEQIISQRRAVNDVIDGLRGDLSLTSMSPRKLADTVPATPAGQKLKALKEEHGRLSDEAQQLRTAGDLRRLKDVGFVDDASGDTLFGQLNLKIKAESDAIRQEMSELRTAREEFISAIRAGTKEGKQRLTEIVNRRMDAGEFADEFAIALQQKRQGHTALTELAGADPERFATLAARFPDKTVKFLDADVAKNLFGKHGVLERLHTADSWGGSQAIKLLDSFTNSWKVWTALPFPQSRARDWVSNVLLLQQGGVSMRGMFASMGEAGRLTRHVGAALAGDDNALAKLTAMTIKAGDGSTITGRELFSILHEKGVLNSGFFRDEITLGAMDVLKDNPAALGPVSGRLLGPLATAHDAIISPAFKVSEFLDNHTKILGVLGDMKAGASIDDAIDHVRKWTYDSRAGRNLTSFERYRLRRFIPFYTFTKWAFKTETQAFLSRPGTVTVWDKIIRSARGMTGLKTESEYQQAVPEFIRENFGVATGKDAEGNPSFMLLGSSLPIGAIAPLTDAVLKAFSGEGVGDVGEALGSQLSPVFKIPLESMAGWDFYSGREKTRFKGERKERFGVSMPAFWADLIDNVRVLSSLDKLNVVGADRLIDRGPLLPTVGPDGDLQLGQLLASPFSVVPAREAEADVDQRLAFKRARQESQRSRLRGLLKKRLLDKETPTQVDDIESIQALIADVEAQQRTRVGLESRFGITRR